MSFGLFMTEKARSAASRKPDRLNFRVLLCIDVFALKSVGVVSAASHFDDFVEAPAATKNHSALSSALQRSSLNQYWKGFLLNAFRIYPVQIEVP
jgi:nitrate reductase NapE component